MIRRRTIEAAAGIALLALVCVCVFCVKHSGLTSKKVVIDGRTMLYGQVSRAQLYFDYPDWLAEEKNYQPQAKTISALKSLAGEFQVLIFLGTWCPDSKREVPHFFKIVKQAALEDRLEIEMWAVDRHKQLDNDLPQRYHIEYVPTFIFFKDGREIGRVIESPQSLYLEEDVLKILSGK